MKRVVTWRRLDTPGLEYTELQMDPLRIEGWLLVIEESTTYAVSYKAAFYREGKTRAVSISLRREGTRSVLRIARNSHDRWTVNGMPAPQLDGLADIDLSVTPSTNTPPLRRLRLAIGQSAEVTAAWVRFPILEITPLRQIYRRVDASKYLYEAPQLDFAAEIACDGEGVVQRYGDLWTQV